MNPENHKQYFTITKLVIATIFILGVGYLGWWLGRSSAPQPTSEPVSSAKTSNTNSSADGRDLKSLVSYNLPDGWKEATCPNTAGSVFVIPAGADPVDCDASPSSPIKISVDPANTDDCNDLQNVQNVRKHICVSLFINDMKSLKAETIYSQESSYRQETSINAYYINTGKDIIKVEYIHDSNNYEYQTGLDQLARSVQVK